MITHGIQKKFQVIGINEIFPNPNQPRKTFDRYELAKLSESIKQNGILQPLSVRKKENFYELIAGERRLKAAAMAGLKKIPCSVFKVDDKTALIFSIIENLQRSDLDFFEEAEGINRLIEEYGLSHCKAAENLGMAQSTLSNKLRILRLSKELRQKIVAASLTERHARALLRLPKDDRNDALDYIIARGLSLSESEKYIENLLSPKSEASDKPQPQTLKHKSSIGDLRIFANSLTRLVDTMAFAGISAKQEKRETKDYIEYKIKIKKAPAEQPVAQQLRLIADAE